MNCIPSLLFEKIASLCPIFTANCWHKNKEFGENYHYQYIIILLKKYSRIKKNRTRSLAKRQVNAWRAGLTIIWGIAFSSLADAGGAFSERSRSYQWSQGEGLWEYDGFIRSFAVGYWSGWGFEILVLRYVDLLVCLGWLEMARILFFGEGKILIAWFLLVLPVLWNECCIVQSDTSVLLERWAFLHSFSFAVKLS